jgi:hemoglobin
MKTTSQRRILLFFIVLAVGVLTTGVLVRAQAKAEPSLYKRIGGYDAIAAVVDDFIPRIATDPQLTKFFSGHGIDSKKRLRQLVVEELCEGTGGPCFYTGRSMKASHAGLGITDSDWQVAVNHLVATLDKFKVKPKEKDELLSIASSLKTDIVAPASAAGMQK